MTHYITTKIIIEPLTDVVNVGTYLSEQKFYIDLFGIELGINTNIYLDNQNDFVIEQPELLDTRISSNIFLEEQNLVIDQLSLQEKIYLDTQQDIVISLNNYDGFSIGDGVQLDSIDLLIEQLDLKRDEDVPLYVTNEFIISLLEATVETVEKLKFPLVKGLTNTTGVTFTKGLTNTTGKTFTKGLTNTSGKTFVKGLTNTRR